jgi:hypothetical protein
VTACACERSGDVALVHALHLLNGEDIMNKIRHRDGRLSRLLDQKKPHDEIVRELFLTTFARGPTNGELDALRTYSLGRPIDRTYYEDVFWALLNSKNFIFNH